MRARWDEGGGRILLGDNTNSVAVVVRPIRFQCAGAWSSSALPSTHICEWLHVYSFPTCAKFLLVSDLPESKQCVSGSIRACWMWFVVDNVALGQDFLQLLPFPPDSYFSTNVQCPLLSQSMICSTNTHGVTRVKKIKPLDYIKRLLVGQPLFEFRQWLPVLRQQVQSDLGTCQMGQKVPSQGKRGLSVVISTSGFLIMTPHFSAFQSTGYPERGFSWEAVR